MRKFSRFWISSDRPKASGEEGRICACVVVVIKMPTP